MVGTFLPQFLEDAIVFLSPWSGYLYRSRAAFDKFVPLREIPGNSEYLVDNSSSKMIRTFPALYTTAASQAAVEKIGYSDWQNHVSESLEVADTPSLRWVVGLHVSNSTPPRPGTHTLTGLFLCAGRRGCNAASRNLPSRQKALFYFQMVRTGPDQAGRVAVPSRPC